MNIFCKNCVLLLFALGLTGLSATPVEARLVYSSEEDGIHTPAFYLNQDDTSDDFVDLNFGTSAGAQLRYDVVNDKFFLNRDLDLEASELQNFKVERLSVAPVCDAPNEGRMYFNTTSDQTFVCDGSVFNGLENGLITGAEIVDGTVDTADIADNAVTSAKILDGTITTADIANGTITFADINATDITLADFTNDLALTSAQIFVGNGSNIATGVVAGGDVSVSNTGAFSLSTNSVSDNEIDYTQVTLSDFTNDAGFITTDNDTLDALSCASGEVAKWNGAVWVCGVDIDTDTTYSAGTGISLVGTTFSSTLGTSIGIGELENGGNNQVLTTTGAGVPQWENKSNFATAAQGLLANTALQSGDNISELTNDAGFITTDNDTLDALSCAFGEIAKWNGSAWACAADAGAITYSAGAGLTLTGTTFSSLLGTSIESSEITNGTILAEDISTGAITSVKIQDNAVTTNKINDGSVTSAKIADGTITAADLAFGSVGAAAIIDGSVGTNELATGAVTNVKMANGSVTGGTGGIIQDGSITAADLAFGSVGAAAIIDGSVGTNELASNSVTTVKINDNAVTAIKLADNAVTSAKIAFAAVDADAIGPNAVGDSEINYAQVTLSDFTNDAGFVTTDNDTTYSAGTGMNLVGTTFSSTLGTDISTGELQDDAVTSAKILDGTITTADIANGTITFADINATDITLADFTNDLALTSAQIFVGNGSNIATGVAASGDVTLSNTGAFTLAANAVDGTNIALGSDTAGDLMFYNGTDWARLPVGTAGQVLQVNGAADAPIWNDSTNTKYQFIDIFGCVRGSATAGTVAGGNSPVIRFDSANNSQMRCSFPVPSDWQSGTDINVEVYYSPSDNTAGNVQFELLHAAFGIGETVTSGSFTDTITTAQTISASSQLNIYELSEDIPAGTLAADDMLNINFTRTPGAAADTYAGDINIHQLRISYTGKEVQ